MLTANKKDLSAQNHQRIRRTLGTGYRYRHRRLPQDSRAYWPKRAVHRRLHEPRPDDRSEMVHGILMNQSEREDQERVNAASETN